MARVSRSTYRSRTVVFACIERRLPAREDGGAEGDRTLDLRIANATLSQLSYRPTARRAILASRSGRSNLPARTAAGPGRPPCGASKGRGIPRPPDRAIIHAAPGKTGFFDKGGR